MRTAAAALCFAIALAAFVDFRDIVPASLKHAIASVQFVPSALTLAVSFHITALACIAILALTLAIGRIYCSVLCPLGILQDVIARIAAKIRRTAPYKLPYRKPRDILRHSILAATLLAIAAGWAGVALAWLDPYSNFGRIASSLFRPLAVLANNIGAKAATALDYSAAIPKVNIASASIGALLPPLLILTTLVIMAAFRGRLWCNTLCPVGTLLGAVSARALWRLRIDKTVCRKCGDCLRACKAQCIDLRAGEIDFSRCVACYDCVSVCDDRGIGYRWHGIAPAKKAPAQTPPAGGRRAFINVAATGVLATAGASAFLATRNRLAQNRPAGKQHDLEKAGNPGVVAPPGAGATARILSQCTACQLCVSACPSHVLEPAFFEYGSFAGLMKPRLNFDKNFCNINCTVCADVCPDGALLPLTHEAKQTTRIGLAYTVHPRCIIITEGTACGACAEHCPTAALQMKKTPAHPDPLPVVDARYCIGCGACQFACPPVPKAIIVSGLDTHETAEVLVQEKVTAPASAAGDFAF